MRQLWRNGKSSLKLQMMTAENIVYLERFAVSIKNLCLRFCAVQKMKCYNNLSNEGAALSDYFNIFWNKLSVILENFCSSLKNCALICLIAGTCIKYIVFILERQSFKHIINQVRHLLIQTGTVSHHSYLFHTSAKENLSCSECSNCEIVNISHPNTVDQYSSKKQQRRYSLKLWKDRISWNMTSSLQSKTQRENFHRSPNNIHLH